MSTTPPIQIAAPTPGAVSLAIDGMSCGHCVAAVRDALTAVPGLAVERVTVGAATVVPDAANAERVVDAALAAVADAGYDARVASRR